MGKGYACVLLPAPLLVAQALPRILQLGPLILVAVLALGLPCILRLGSLMLVVLVKLPLLVAGSASVELILTLFLFAEWS